jgi:hypothetical protein
MGTLIESNFAGILSPEQFTALNDDWHQTMSALVEQGMIPIADLQSSLGVRPRILQLYGSGANEIGT